MKEEGYTQREIAEKIGWTRDLVARYTILLDKVVTQVLDLAKQHQEGRVASDVTSVTFNFTEGWFRTSGIYDISPKYQLELMERFIKDKCKWKKI